MRNIKITTSETPPREIIDAYIPDYHVWLDDNNFIEVNIVGGHKPIIITIDLEYNIEVWDPDVPGFIKKIIRSNTMTYTSSEQGNNKILFDLNNNLKDLAAYMIWASGEEINIRISCLYDNLVNPLSKEVTSRLRQGKSFLTKSHGSSNVINLYNQDELNTVNLWVPFSSDCSIGNKTFTNLNGYSELDLSDVITQNGEYTMCLSPADADTIPPIVTAVYDNYLTPYSSDILFDIEEPAPGDSYPNSLLNTCEQKTKCYKVIYQEHCCDYPFVELKYRDTDGNVRYIGGKLLNENDTINKKLYPVYSNTIRYTNNFYISECSKQIRVAVKDIHPGAEVWTILYSNELFIRDYNGDWMPCVLEDTTLNTTNDYTKVIFTVIVNKI